MSVYPTRTRQITGARSKVVSAMATFRQAREGDLLRQLVRKDQQEPLHDLGASFPLTQPTGSCVAAIRGALTRKPVLGDVSLCSIQRLFDRLPNPILNEACSPERYGPASPERGARRT